MVIAGTAKADAFDLARGEVVFTQGERVDVQVGDAGVTCLLAYTGIGGPIIDLLDRIEARARVNSPRLGSAQSQQQPSGPSQ